MPADLNTMPFRRQNVTVAFHVAVLPESRRSNTALALSVEVGVLR